MVAFWRPEKKSILVVMSGEISKLSKISATKKIIVERKDIEAVIGFKRSGSDDKGNGSAVGTNGGVLSLVVGQRSSRRDGGEEASGGDGDKFFFDGDVFFPGMEAGLGDLDLVSTWGEVKGVIGGGGETTVNENLGLFRMGRGS